MVPIYFIKTKFLKLQNQEINKKTSEYVEFLYNKNLSMVTCIKEYIKINELIREN